VEAEYIRGHAKSPQKREKAPFCDQVTRLPAPIRWLVAPAKAGEMPLEALFPDIENLILGKVGQEPPIRLASQLLVLLPKPPKN